VYTGSSRTETRYRTPRRNMFNVSQGEEYLAAGYYLSTLRVAPYFSKVECLCFEEQKLSAGEEVDILSCSSSTRTSSTTPPAGISMILSCRTHSSGLDLPRSQATGTDPHSTPQGPEEFQRRSRTRCPRRRCPESFGLWRLRASVEENLLRLGQTIHLKHKVTYNCT